MYAERLARVKQIFQDTLEQPPAERDAFVVAACGDDRELRAAVDALVAAERDAGPFLGSPTLGDAVTGEDARAVFERLQHKLAGRYSLVREVGRGGMGIVYLARDVALDRHVAIKVLPPNLASDSAARERFVREARTAAALSHPNIVPIHLVEEEDDLVFFVMAFVDGESLGERVRRAGPLKPADAAKLVQEVAWALGYAHGRGVIHRDIKPDNILIEKNSARALVTDFGIARVTTTGTLSAQGEVLGTLRYMSPEQASAETVIDGRTDLYSLGVTAFFALTGRLPFESENPAALLAMHVSEPAPPLLSVVKHVPSKLAEAVDRCLAKAPEARFTTGEALAEAIADAQVTRREVAPSVRQFLDAARNGVGHGIALGVLWFMGAVAFDTIAARGMAPGPLLFPLTLALTFLTPLGFLLPLHAGRGVVRAGLNEQDVAEAVAASAGVRDANVEYELTRVDNLARRLAKPWMRLVFFGFAAYPLQYVPKMLANIFGAGVSLVSLPLAFQLVLFMGGETLLFSLAIAPRRVARMLTRGTPEMAGWLHKLWAGPIGRWFFRIVGIGLHKRAARSVPDAAPTEVLLGRAAQDLFERLPKDQRDRLGDVHEVISGLEHLATTLRARRDELANALADVGPAGGSDRRDQLVAELHSARQAVEARLGTAVSALENLRLDLLRLRAGVGHPDDLTQSLEEARAIGEAVDIELAARQDVESVVRR